MVEINACYGYKGANCCFVTLANGNDDGLVVVRNDYGEVIGHFYGLKSLLTFLTDLSNEKYA